MMNLKALWGIQIKRGLSSRVISGNDQDHSSNSCINTKSINYTINSNRAKLKEALERRFRCWQRAVRRLQARLWQELQVVSIMSLAGCCFSSAAMQGSAPYQRLKRSRSDECNINGDGDDAVSSSVGNSAQHVTGLPSTNPPSIHFMTPDLDADADDFVGFVDVEADARPPTTPAPLRPLSGGGDDTVVLKIGILGDSDTGKTSFMAKYVAVEQSQEYVETIGVASVEKVFRLQNNVTIALSIWDLGGHWQCANMLPMVCRDATAIFIMFDLTRRSTLQSVKEWFIQARECNKSAIPVLIGTKYDRFIQMPLDIQLAMIRQARFYAQAMGASLFFSSVTHNINIHKIFKVIVAKVFDLPCNISRNLNLGEPIIDY